MKTEHSLKKCIDEARNFIDAAESAIDDLESRTSQYQFKSVAKAKRRSMDLHDALVELRKSNRV